MRTHTHKKHTDTFHKLPPKLEYYRIKYERIEEKGKTTVGQAADTDTLAASANAYLSALNKLIIKRKKTAPDDENLSAQI